MVVIISGSKSHFIAIENGERSVVSALSGVRQGFREVYTLAAMGYRF
jgi:hypothetical protein